MTHGAQKVAGAASRSASSIAKCERAPRCDPKFVSGCEATAPDPALHTPNSAGPPLLDHDSRGGEPLDCGIVKAVLEQHLACVLREFGRRRLQTGGRP